METGMFFKIMGFLLIIGTFASLLAGVPMPGSPTSSTPVGNLSPGLNQVNTTTTTCYYTYGNYPTFCDHPGCPETCTTRDTADDWFGIPAFIGWVAGVIYGGITFGWQIFAFFSGVATFVGGASTFALPVPLNFIFIIGISFAWIFIAIETARRIIGLVWGR